MAFNAGAIEASLAVDLAQFSRDMDSAEARVKRFEDASHKVKISAVFDTSSLSRARQMFAQLDNNISKDAMSRLRSSPQGSVLGALNALFSPHPVTGAPSPQQAAQQGLLGKIIQAPGGGGTTGPAGGNSQGNVVQDVLGSAGGGQQSNANRVSTLGMPPQNETTTDKVNVVGGPTDNNITTTDRVNTVGLPSDNAISTTDTVNQRVIPARDPATGRFVGTDTTSTDTVKEELDPAAAAKAEDDAKSSGDRSGKGWASAFSSHLTGLFSNLGGGGSGSGKSGGGSGGGAGGLAGNILGGIGPSILGIGLKATAITGAVGTALAALPALGGVIGAGVGTALIGGLVAGVVAGSTKLKAQFTAIGADAKSVLAAAAGPIIPALSAVLKQVPGLLKSVEPELAGVFKTVAPQLQGVFAGLVPIVKGLVSVIQAAAPAFGPFIGAIEKLVSGLFPGLAAITKAVVPVMSQFGTIMGQLGTSLGALFGDMAPAVRASMTVLGALFGLIGGLLPVIAKLADVFAVDLAPVITAFAGTIKALSPSLTSIGTIIADLAGAIIGDLASALGALATLLTGIAPGLNAFAKAIGQVFTVLENTGTFAILGNAIEDLAAPLAKLINTLLTGLVPVLPPIVNFIGQLSTLLATTLANAVQTLLPPLTTLVTGVLQVLDALLPVLLPLLLSFAGVFTGALVSAVSAVAGALAAVINAIPPPVLGAIATGIAAVVGGMKLWAATTAILSSGIESALAGTVGGMIGTLKEFALATEGVTLAQKAQLAGMLALDAVSPLAWAVIAGAAVAGLVIGLNQLAKGSHDLVDQLTAQDNATGYNISGYQKLAGQLTTVSASFTAMAQSSGNAVKGQGGQLGQVAQQYSATATAMQALAVNMQGRLTTLSANFGVSQTQIEKWATAAGISAAKFGGAGENVGLLTTQIAGFINKNAAAVTATSGLSANIAIFGDSVFNATTQLDAFNGIWNTLVGNLLTKQVAVTQSAAQFDSLKQTIASSGASSDAASQSFQSYISQVGASASALQKGGASVSQINGYLQTQISNIESLGPLNKGQEADLQALKSFQDALANSTHGLNSAQQTFISQVESHVIADLKAMGTDTPVVNTAIGNLANSIAQTGANSASTAADRKALIADLKQAGATSQQAASLVNGLTKSLQAIPKSVPVAITVTETEQLIQDVAAPGAAVGQNILGEVTVIKKATGGLVSGPGGPADDAIPAWLSNGEYVLSAGAVSRYGTGFLDQVNAQEYASGGMVSGYGASISRGYAYAGTRGAQGAPPGRGATTDDLADLLRELNGHMRQQVDATRAVPAGVGAHVGGAINGSAHDASFRSRYPRSN